MAGGVQREAAARLAVQEINREGLLLPDKRLEMLTFDTVTEERPTVRATLSLCDDYKVLGIVGAASSTESTAAALVAEIFDTSLISYASTSAALSDKDRFRTFFRTVPPDSFQARAIIDICVKAGWKHVTIIHTTDAYGTSLSTQFQSNAAEVGIGVNQTLTIQVTGTPAAIADALAAQMAKINGKLEKIFIVFALAADAAKVLINARDLGLLDGQHAFIGVDGVMQEALLTTLNATAQASSSAAAHRMAAGVLGTQPSTGDSPEFKAMLDIWHAQNSSQFAGSGPGTTPNLFAPFAWDCVYAYAHAIARVLRKNNMNEAFLNAANITEELKNTNITGVTGPVSFDKNNDRQGSTYDIRNFQLQDDGTVKLVTVGSWNPSGGVVYKADAQVQYAINVQDPMKVFDPKTVGTVACSSFEVSLGATCLACDDGEIFVAAADGEPAHCDVCGANYHPSSDRVTCVLDDGIIALIAILVIVAVLSILAGALIAYRRITKRRAEEERIALTAPAVVWEVSDELAELSGDGQPGLTAAGVVSTLDKSAPVTVLMKVGEVPTFGVNKGSRMPVMELLTDTIVITNRGSQDISYVVSVPGGNGAYECTVLPGVGVVKKHSSRELTMRFKLMQTMKVDRHVKVVVEGHGNVYFPLRFEGELSQRLDPDEIELFGKPIGDGAFGTVYRGRYRGTAVAVKVLRRQNELAADQNNNFLKEIALFQKLRNPYIVSFIGASYIPGKLCIAEGTPVQLADGTARPIEQLAEARGAGVRVASPKVVQQAAGNKRAHQGAVVVESARCSDGWFSGVKECVQLTLEDGRTLVCTADHEVLAADGVWLQAGDAKVGVTRLAVAARDAPLDVAGADAAERTPFAVARCALRMDDDAARRHALAFARQLGAAQQQQLAAAVDREAAACDDALLGDAERCARGDDAGVAAAPRAFVREFVAARIGGAAWTVSVAANGAVLCGASEDEAAFVGALLARLGVAVSERASGDARLVLDADAALQFAEQVGVRYSVVKQVRLAHAAVAWRGARAFAQQRAWIAKRADELLATSASSSLFAARSCATSELAAREALLAEAPAFEVAPVSLLSVAAAAAPTMSLRVVDVRAAGVRRVYDLSVPGNTSFVANGVAVHNCICTELLERGTVLELIQKARISLALKYKLMLDTASAVDFLHSNGVLYRDLKPDNLLVFSVSHNASVNCKLSDFGTSRIVDDPKAAMQHTSGIGTPIYMAPEMMDATQKYTLKVDVYSFGMLCWELMAEKQPFNEVKRIWDLPRIVVDGLRPTIDESWPRPIQRLIAEAWMHSAERRPTMKEVLAVLQELFESERRHYEKAKKNRKADDEIGDGSKPRTAHTGNLEELIQKSGAEPVVTIDTSDMARAPDVEGGETTWEPAAKKKGKKKVQKQTEEQQ